ncbi:MAG: 23S rRNA (adenine(2030)-N(6))-methyltransferase RlmJ [Alphaproteobacteria bacterium]|nr:23S rRNA (adenine(2030)-N(6))-methyltransferase RlmJ [Alphaproteobacteria bacterium]
MNYRHAFHAGNHADVLKHMALVLCLDRLMEKPAPLFALDTHAGAGAYDLWSADAERNPEWRQGVGALGPLESWPDALDGYRRGVATLNPDGGLRHYPGSPALIGQRLRAGDRFAACERHPEEASALRANFGARAEIHERDGYEALIALSPPKERRGLILIDPPYEDAEDMIRAPRAIAAARKRFAHGVYVWWRPLKARGALDAGDGEARMGAACEILRADLWTAPPRPDGKLTASSLLILNPPFGVAARLREGLGFCAARLGAQAGFSVREG